MRQREIDENMRKFIKQLDEVINKNDVVLSLQYFQIKAQLLSSLKETIEYRDLNNPFWEEDK
jgi:hypothetical protein